MRGTLVCVSWGPQEFCRHGAMFAPGLWASTEEGQPGTERYRCLPPTGEETYCGTVEGVIQIMMRCEETPRRCLATNDVQLDLRPALKTPPGKALLGGTV